MTASYPAQRSGLCPPWCARADDELNPSYFGIRQAAGIAGARP